ncbi:hypothetical protein FIBSPDRAFT_889917 [Athelia psychrophila]|uniref:Uncharacterized protein n=1 Tax=Athelia psychrophila TaxID=1759441 RepID=A0A166LK24_9AGAM|nr:hypothetical protein FIBSPDRAFT_889917 [Fibularhizoctonia sp. CBS 109695]
MDCDVSRGPVDTPMVAYLAPKGSVALTTQVICDERTKTSNSLVNCISRGCQYDIGDCFFTASEFAEQSSAVKRDKKPHFSRFPLRILQTLVFTHLGMAWLGFWMSVDECSRSFDHTNESWCVPVWAKGYV